MKKTKNINPKKKVYVSFEYGNDLTAEIGKKRKPFKTVLAADKYSKKYKGSEIYLLNESEVVHEKSKREFSLLSKLKISLSQKTFVLTIDTKKDHFIENCENLIVHCLNKKGNVVKSIIQIIDNEISIKNEKNKLHTIRFEDNKIPYKKIDVALMYF